MNVFENVVFCEDAIFDPVLYSTGTFIATLQIRKKIQF